MCRLHQGEGIRHCFRKIVVEPCAKEYVRFSWLLEHHPYIFISRRRVLHYTDVTRAYTGTWVTLLERSTQIRQCRTQFIRKSI